MSPSDTNKWSPEQRRSASRRGAPWRGAVPVPVALDERGVLSPAEFAPRTVASDRPRFLADSEWRREKGIEAIRIDYADEQHTDDVAVVVAVVVAALLVTAAIALLRGGGL